MDRLRSGLEKIAENVKDGQKTESVIVTNIGSMEVLAIQNFVIEVALDSFFRVLLSSSLYCHYI